MNCPRWAAMSWAARNCSETPAPAIASSAAPELRSPDWAICEAAACLAEFAASRV